MSVDFAELKTRVNILQVANLYGLDLKGKGSQLRGECIACKSGGPRALAVNTEKQSAYCFSIRKGGDLIWLASHINGTGQREAAEDVAKQLRLDTSPQRPDPAPKEKDELEVLRDMIDELDQRVTVLEENKIVKLRAP